MSGIGFDHIAIAGADGRLVYRWPDSPLCIAVDVDPAAEEGPVAIEFASPRTVERRRPA